MLRRQHLQAANTSHPCVRPHDSGVRSRALSSIWRESTVLRPTLNKNLILFNHVWNSSAAGACGSWLFVKWRWDCCICFPPTPSRRTGPAVLSHARRKGRFRPSAGTADAAPHQQTKDRSASGPSHICAFCTFLRISHILAYSAHSARPCAFCTFGRILPVSAHSAQADHFRAVTHSQPLSFLWI